MNGVETEIVPHLRRHKEISLCPFLYMFFSRALFISPPPPPCTPAVVLLSPSLTSSFLTSLHLHSITNRHLHTTADASLSSHLAPRLGVHHTFYLSGRTRSQFHPLPLSYLLYRSSLFTPPRLSSFINPSHHIRNLLFEMLGSFLLLLWSHLLPTHLRTFRRPASFIDLESPSIPCRVPSISI